MLESITRKVRTPNVLDEKSLRIAVQQTTANLFEHIKSKLQTRRVRHFFSSIKAAAGG
jgi:hypothetical protein